MIVTCKKSIPFHWMLVALLPWSALTISQQVTGNAVIFSLKKFLENPAALTFVLSLPALLSLVTITVSNFLSDRIWTRYGRRKPFVLVGFAGTAVCLFAMPLMPNFWSLVAVYLLLGIFLDLDSPIEPLKQEIVPPQQRGRATGVMSWINQAAQLTFMFFIFGRFDDVTFMWGVPITGETAIYWSAGLIAFSMLLLIALGIKETRQHSRWTGERLSLKTFFGGLTDRELLPVYILIFGAAVLHASTGPMGALLYTDQWGYTKQDMGTNIAIGGVLNLFLIALLTLLADRLDRLRAYQTLILVAIGLNIAYYSYVHFVLPDRRPTLLEIILFGEMMSVVGILTGLIYTPLIYDYVVRNKMGTYVAGAQLVTRLTNLVTVNGAGLFIVGYAALFQPPAGEMARVALRQPSDADTVRAGLSGLTTGTAPLHIAVWNGDGVVEGTGRGMEIRWKNPDSEVLAAQLRETTDELNPLLERSRVLDDRATIAAKAGDAALEQRLLAEKAALQPRLNALQAEAATRREDLDRRARAFANEVTALLAPTLAEDGAQIRAVSFPTVQVAALTPGPKYAPRRLDALLPLARERFPELVDLVPGPTEQGAEVSWIPGAGTDSFPARFSDFLTEHVAEQVKMTESIRSVPGVALTLETVESPIPRRLSPITGFLQNVRRWLGQTVPADARVLAAGRSLRSADTFPHAAARTENGTITFTVLPKPGLTDPATDDAINRRLAEVTGPGSGPVRQLYDRAVDALAGQKLTVPRPLLAAEYVPVKYDYMAGNLLTIALSFVGFGITMVFYHLNRTGAIRKWGLEEAEATE